MSGKPRYIYFNLRGRGELPRLIIAAGGLDVVDERVSPDDWIPKYKSQTPYGQLPCLVIGNKWYAQKLAISYYLARQAGLYPKSGDDLENLALNHALLFAEEVLENVIAAYVERQYHNKLESLEKVKKETLPLKLPMLEKLLKENGTGYYAGNKLTIADLSAFDLIEHVHQVMGPGYLNAYPLIKANFEKVGQVEGIKNYVNNRPKIEEGYNW